MLRNSTFALPALSGISITFGMPTKHRNQYFNKESGKVNSGLDFGGANEDGEQAEGNIGPWNTRTTLVDIDFSKFEIPTTAFFIVPSTQELVNRLLNPPPNAFVYGVLSFQWVLSALGTEHFEYRESDERYILTQTSPLRRKGTELGLPAVYVEWLCGDDENVSTTEQAMWLTKEFFEKELDRERT